MTEPITSPAPGALADLQARLAEAEKVIQRAHVAFWFDLRDVVQEPIGDHFNQAVRDAALRTKAYLENRTATDTLLASSPAASAPPVDGGGRELRVTKGADGRIVLSSLGGGMPVAIRMTEAEATQVADAILAHPGPTPTRRAVLADA